MGTYDVSRGKLRSRGLREVVLIQRVVHGHGSVGAVDGNGLGGHGQWHGWMNGPVPVRQSEVGGRLLIRRPAGGGI